MAANERSDVTTPSASRFPQIDLVLTSPGMLQRSERHSQELCGERQIHHS